MKAISYLIIASLFILNSACKSKKQDLVLPAGVIEIFKMKYPEAQNTNWTKEDSGKFEVTFNLQKVTFSSIFSSGGQWILTEKKIRIFELPATVNRTLEDGFGDYKIQSIIQVESSSNGNYFFVKAKNGKELKYIYLSHEGVILNNINASKDLD
jgi:hypothetical protein